MHLRFEDVTQDGRLVLEALPNALGPTVWRGLLQHEPSMAACFQAGVVPILSRFVLEGLGGPVSAHAPIEALGTYQLARTDDGRFMLDMWADLHGKIARTYGKTEHDGERVRVGRLFAEHVLTRPFASVSERRVTQLDFPGAPVVTETRPASPSHDSIVSLPLGATPLEDGKSADLVPLPFGLVHTDSNHHVNSLVYLRVFEEAALRRLATLGQGTALLGRSLEIAYRKPCFAGQVMRVVQQAFQQEGKLGVVAILVDDQEARTPERLAQARPHAYARLLFEA